MKTVRRILSIDVIVGVYFHWIKKNVFKGFDRNAGMSLVFVCLSHPEPLLNDSLDMRSRLLTEEGSTCACCHDERNAFQKTLFSVSMFFIDFYLWKFSDDFRCCCLCINIYTTLRLRQFFASQIGTLKKHRADIKSKIYMNGFRYFSGDRWGSFVMFSVDCILYYLR